MYNTQQYTEDYQRSCTVGTQSWLKVFNEQPCVVCPEPKGTAYKYSYLDSLDGDAGCASGLDGRLEVG